MAKEIDKFNKWFDEHAKMSMFTNSTFGDLKLAFLAGWEAAEQSVQPTVESGREIPAEVVKVESVLPAKSG